MKERALHKIFLVFWSVFTKLWSYEVLNRRKLRRIHEYTKHLTTGFLYIFLLILRRRNLLQSYTVFVINFSRTYEITKLSDVIQANKHTWYANFGLRVNFRDFLLRPLWFLKERDHFKKMFLLYSFRSFLKIF